MALSPIAGDSQVKYFDQYLTLSNVDVVSFSGYRIEQVWLAVRSVSIGLLASTLEATTYGMTTQQISSVSINNW
jgi:hypothetical protein